MGKVNGDGDRDSMVIMLRKTKLTIVGLSNEQTPVDMVEVKTKEKPVPAVKVKDKKVPAGRKKSGEEK